MVTITIIISSSLLPKQGKSFKKNLAQFTLDDMSEKDAKDLAQFTLDDMSEKDAKDLAQFTLDDMSEKDAKDLAQFTLDDMIDDAIKRKSEGLEWKVLFQSIYENARKQ